MLSRFSRELQVLSLEPMLPHGNANYRRAAYSPTPSNGHFELNGSGIVLWTWLKSWPPLYSIMEINQ